MKSKPTLVVFDPKGDTELFKLCMSKLGKNVVSCMSERLPFDQGREAYLAHKTPDENPYGSDDLGYEEWLNGWSHEEDIDSELWESNKDSYQVIKTHTEY